MQDLTRLFSRPVKVISLPESGTSVEIEAKPAECAALAEADGLIAIKRLRAHFNLRPQRSGGAVEVRGQVDATVVQTCTISLDEFDASLSEEVDLVFVPEEGLAAWKKKNAKAKDEPDLEAEDVPDLIVDGRIDLGAIAAEYLALGIDPYPRKPDATFDPVPLDTEPEPSSFAALARLKKGP